MRLSNFILFALIIASNPIQATAAEASLKTRLLQITDKMIAQQEEGFKAFKEQERKGTLQVQIPFALLEQQYLAQQKHYRELRGRIAKANEKDIPENLVLLSLKPGAPAEYPELGDYLLECGTNAVAPILRHYKRANEFTKASWLGLLGSIGSKESLPLIRKATLDHSLRVASAAIHALRMINNSESLPELHELLTQTNSVEIRKVILDQLQILQDPKRCSIFFDYASNNKIPFEALFNQNLEACPEDIIGGHLPFIITRIISNDNKSDGWFAIKLIDSIKSRPYLKQLLPVFPLALKEYYSLGEKLDNYRSIPTPGSRAKEEYKNLIERIANNFTTEDIQEWLNQKPSDALTITYLKDLLQQKSPKTSSQDQTETKIALTVSNKKGEIFCKGMQTISRSGAIDINCPAYKTFGPYNIHTVSSIDIPKMRVILNDIHIDLRPSPVQFQAELPFVGSYSIRLRGEDGHEYIWQFEHIQ